MSGPSSELHTQCLESGSEAVRTEGQLCSHGLSLEALRKGLVWAGGRQGSAFLHGGEGQGLSSQEI